MEMMTSFGMQVSEATDSSDLMKIAARAEDRMAVSDMVVLLQCSLVLCGRIGSGRSGHFCKGLFFSVTIFHQLTSKIWHTEFL